jgi:hypothetical protein
MFNRNHWIPGALGGMALLLSSSLFAGPPPAEATEASYMYDEGAYTEYVESTLQKLDLLYLDFCGACGVDMEKATVAKKEFLITVHALTMLVDILAQSQLEEMTPHPYID